MKLSNAWLCLVASASAGVACGADGSADPKLDAWGTGATASTQSTPQSSSPGGGSQNGPGNPGDSTDSIAPSSSSGDPSAGGATNAASSGSAQNASDPANGGTLPTNSTSSTGANAASQGGSASSAAASGGTTNADAGGTTSAIEAGGVTVTPQPFESVTAAAAVRKVKNLLIGLAPTDADVERVTTSGAAGLQELIAGWISDTTTQPFFRDKMLFFFRNAFQQVGFTPTEDFKPQLLENGGFDFGPLGYRGDDAFARIVQNLQDSFALTAWQLVMEGRPFTETLTTKRFMMTTALKSLYAQIEMPNDQPYAFIQGQQTISWKIDQSGRDIPLADTLDPNSPDYLVFSDVPPVTKVNNFLSPTCQGNANTVTYTGYAQLFQRLLGFTPRYPFAAQPECWEHPSKPYFTTNDLTDWQWVTIRPLNSGESVIRPYDLPTLRSTTTMGLALPRVGFYTTPAFLALWNTNNSNQHRVTANQTLLVALNRSFTPDNVVVPINTAFLDANHSVEGTDCYACHKNLDPMRQFWSGQFDFNDRNDFLTKNFFGGVANPRPESTGGVFAFGSVNSAGASLADVGTLLGQVQDTSDAESPISRFAISTTQKMCFFANSTACAEYDPEFRRVAAAFEKSNFSFPVLVKELFASPLVTGATDTETFADGGITVSINRRNHLCASLSNRLNRSDICALAAPAPNSEQNATLTIAASVAADAFSRGSETPVTPSPPTLFYRAATEMLCENVAALVVDAATNSVFSSGNVATAVADMVSRIMGYPSTDPHYSKAVQILTDHYDAAKATSGTSATVAMRSTFSLACQSPSSLSIGL